MERIIITGAPGTGKTTILHELEDRGYSVLPEMARALIREELDRGGDILPWLRHEAFGEELFERQVAQYHEAPQEPLVFYDRGIPDNLGYLRRDGLQNTRLEKEAYDYPYHPRVFLLPPWPEIYDQDEERREDQLLMREIHQALQEIYNFYGYDILEVPKTTPKARADYVLENVLIDSTT